jgi:hypothetical protein
MEKRRISSKHLRLLVRRLRPRHLSAFECAENIVQTQTLQRRRIYSHTPVLMLVPILCPGTFIDWVSPLTSFKNLSRTGFCVPRNLCNINGQACVSFPDASINEQLGMIASPVGDRSVGNGRTAFLR